MNRVAQRAFPKYDVKLLSKRRRCTEYLNKYLVLNKAKNIKYCTQCDRNFYHCTPFRGRNWNVVSTYLVVTDVKPFVDSNTLAFRLRRIVPGTGIRIFPCINHYTASSYAFHSATNFIFQQTDISSVPIFGILNFSGKAIHMITSTARCECHTGLQDDSVVNFVLSSL
jgi:hypothetical protein